MCYRGEAGEIEEALGSHLREALSSTLFLTQILVQSLEQARTENDFCLRWGDIEFGGQNGRRHRPTIKQTHQNPKSVPKKVGPWVTT